MLAVVVADVSKDDFRWFLVFPHRGVSRELYPTVPC
jgi:hypothetical protein